MQESFVSGRISLNPFRRSSERFCEQSIKVDSVSKIRDMEIGNPEERPSAALKYHNGVGLSIPQNQVSDLTSGPLSTIAAAKISPRAPPSLTSRTAQTTSKGLQINANIFAAAQQYRIKKARGFFKHK